ncbi:MAG: helix-turn-helix domain-containing protein [Lachnospiraceae bacterium]|nr:helix-turn-helix domain-containing protein [Lachnospiraceae bacterium]
MGKRSTRENKSRLQLSREEAGLTREKASELMEYISDDRIDKIERGILEARPEEIITMSECYKDPELCNYYCSHECPIGRKYVPEVKLKDLSQITLEMLASLNNMEKEKNRLIEITVDGVITEDEQEDFNKIKEELDSISLSVSALKMWIDNAILTGKFTE